MRTPVKAIEAGAWMLEHGHRALLTLTGGRFPRRVMGMKPVELHHVGRRSGRTYRTLLTAPLFEPDRVVLVASKGGHPRNPDWYENLVAHPRAVLGVDGEEREMQARTASGEEKAALWPAIVAANRGYAGYQANTSRDIPVVILEPAAPSDR